MTATAQECEDMGRDPAARNAFGLHLPAALHAQLWQHAHAAAPHECVGILGGTRTPSRWEARQLWPLDNVAAQPTTHYQADLKQTWQALRQMRRLGLELVGVYHSHPRGPARYSPQDQAQAAYQVPHLIADLESGQLLAYWLPAGLSCHLIINAGLSMLDDG